MASSIKAARNWLHQQLVAHPDLADVQVVWGGPVHHVENDTVGLMGFEPVDVEVVNFGADSPYDEAYTLHVGVQAMDGGTSPEAAERVDGRGCDLADIVRQVVVDNPTLGGIATRAEPDVWTSDGAVYIEDQQFTGWLMFIDVAVDVVARI